MVEGQRKNDLLVSLERSESVQWPWLTNTSFEFEVNNELTLSTEELHEKLHEDVEDVGLVDISHHVTQESPLRVHNGKQSGNLVDLSVCKKC